MKKFRIILYSFLVFFILVLAFLYIVPGGKIKYQYSFSRPYLWGRGFFHKFGPEDRIINNKIIGDPVYFYLRSPRNFSEAKLKIKYRFSPELIVNHDFINLEAGVLVDKDNWNYSLKPFYNNVLENLTEAQIEDGVLFYQKDQIFSNYQEFLNQSNFSSSTVFYNFQPNFIYIDPSYQPVSDQVLEINQLKGSHSFYLYLKEENLNFDFSFLRQSDTLKDLDLFLYYQDNLIFSDRISFLVEDELFYQLNLSDLPEGVYKLEIKANDQILSSFKTNLSKLVFINKIFLDQSYGPFTLYSNQNNLRIKSINIESLGEIEIASNTFKVDKIFQQFNFSVPKPDSDLVLIKSDSSGFLIEGEALFSFSVDSFFNPNLNKLSVASQSNEADFILAKYSPVIKDGEYYISEISLDLQNAWREKGVYRFIISAPFLKDVDSSNYIEISDLEIELSGKTLLRKINEKLFK